jgi:hypothetical protein
MSTIKQVCLVSVRIAVLLENFLLAGTFTASAVVISPSGLTATPAGNDLILSFPTAGLSYYIVQTSLDLRQWTNSPSGIPGDGTMKTITMSNAISDSHAFYRLSVQTPLSLILPQGTAFAILGHSCGGIQEQVSAGFDVTNGYSTGVVNLSTSCGGSGRGGGYHTTKYTASVLTVWDFTGTVISAIPLTNGVTVNPTTGSDGLGDVIYNAGSAAYLVVPVPAAPTGVTAIQSGDQFQISWTPNGVNPVAILSSTLTATPMNSTAPVLTTTVSGAATTGVIPTLQPQTTYQVTVANTTIGGTGPASSPISVTTSPATVAPSAPTGVAASWSNPDPTGTTDTLIATWQAANPGNSPIDEYLVTITGSDGAGTFTQTVSGTTLTAYFGVDYIPNWSVTVKAHNAAGWGPASSAVNLGGL